MTHRLTPAALSAVLLLVSPAYAQGVSPAATPASVLSNPFYQGPTAMAPRLIGGPLSLKVTGYTRARLMSEWNYDLDASTVQDAFRPYLDLRSTVGLEAVLNQVRVVTSVDLAGSDFDEGMIWGWDNPSRQRPSVLNLRHLYLDYVIPETGFQASIGRQRAHLGLGIVSSVNRDSIKLTQQLGNLGPSGTHNVTAVWVRGGDGNTLWPGQMPVPPGTPVATGSSAPTTVNDPNGAAHDLNALVLAYNLFPAPGQRVQLFGAQQFDATATGAYPQKRFADVNWEATAGAFRGGAELVYLGGQSPAASGQRQTLNSYAAFLTGTYSLGAFDLGLTFGRGGGDDNASDTVNGNFQSLFIDEGSLSYNHLFGDDLWGFNGTDASIGRGAGLANVTILQPSLGWRLSDLTECRLSYTKHWATSPRVAGTGIFGTPDPSGATDIGDEVDLRLGHLFGSSLLYGATSVFIPGNVFPAPGSANAAYKLEIGTETRF